MAKREPMVWKCCSEKAQGDFKAGWPILFQKANNVLREEQQLKAASTTANGTMRLGIKPTTFQLRAPTSCQKGGRLVQISSFKRVALLPIQKVNTTTMAWSYQYMKPATAAGLHHFIV